MDAVLFVRTKAVNFDTSLREAIRLVVADHRDIDTETARVVSAIALDETTLKKTVELQSSGCSFDREDKTGKFF